MRCKEDLWLLACDGIHAEGDITLSPFRLCLSVCQTGGSVTNG